MAWRHVKGPTVSTFHAPCAWPLTWWCKPSSGLMGMITWHPHGACMGELGNGLELQIGLHVCKFNAGPDIGIRVGLTS